MSSHTPEKSTIVLGTAVGYEPANIWVFVESLRRHYDGQVGLLVSSRSSPEFFQYLASRKITPILFDASAWMLPHILFSRFVRYFEVLMMTNVDQVLLTDVADVVFQGHPFAGAPEGELLCFMEMPGRTIGMCPSNRTWVAELFGIKALEQLRDFEISCAGTTIGSRRAVIDYLRRLVGHVRPDQFLPLTGKRGHDQAIHNALLHTNLLPNAVKVPNGRHVFTVGMEADDQFALVDGRIVCKRNGEASPIVHQYNYKPETNAFVTAMYPVPDGKPSLPSNP